MIRNLLTKFSPALRNGLQAIIVNWKTSVTGAVVGVVTVLAKQDIVLHVGKLQLDPLTVTGLLAAAGLLFARDANKSSQDSGIRPVLKDILEDK